MNPPPFDIQALKQQGLANLMASVRLLDAIDTVEQFQSRLAHSEVTAPQVGLKDGTHPLLVAKRKAIAKRLCACCNQQVPVSNFSRHVHRCRAMAGKPAAPEQHQWQKLVDLIGDNQPFTIPDIAQRLVESGHVFISQAPRSAVLQTLYLLKKKGFRLTHTKRIGKLPVQWRLLAPKTRLQLQERQ